MLRGTLVELEPSPEPGFPRFTEWVSRQLSAHWNVVAFAAGSGSALLAASLLRGERVDALVAPAGGALIAASAVVAALAVSKTPTPSVVRIPRRVTSTGGLRGERVAPRPRAPFPPARAGRVNIAAPHRPGPSTHPATTLRAVPTADEIWSAWASPDGVLPVELIGPVPETAWTRPHEGEPHPFAGLEPSLAVDDGRLVAIDEVTPRPPSISTVLEPIVTTGIDRRAWSDGTTLVDGPGPPFDGRDGFIRASAYRSAGALAERPKPGCASCGSPPGEDFRGRPCPDCRRPVCSSCRSRAVIQFGHTWCLGCGRGRTAAPARAAPMAPPRSAVALDPLRVPKRALTQPVISTVPSVPPARSPPTRPDQLEDGPGPLGFGMSKLIWTENPRGTLTAIE